MDYYDYIKLKKHLDWDNFFEWSKKNNYRLILLTTKGTKKYTKYNFKNNDILILGRESSGVPKEVYKKVNEKLFIPMKKGLRSFNVSSAAAIVLGEAVKQLNLI